MPSSRSHLHSFSSTSLPETIYFDSSFVVKTLVVGLPYHQECMDFIRRLEEKQPIVIVSKFSIVELRCAAIKLAIQKFFASKGRRVNNLDNVLYRYPSLVSRFHRHAEQIENDFQNLLHRFKECIQEDVSEEIIKSALPFMVKYNLGSYDALHAATMNYWEVKDIAVFDHVFEDMSDFNIWTFAGSRRFKARQRQRAGLPAL